MALGADGSSVLAMVLGQGLRVTAVGLLVGLVAAAAGGRLLTAFLFEVRPGNPVAYLAAATVLTAVAAVACAAPALRASRVDPVATLTAD